MGSFYKPMELEVWSPDWSLPSVDIDCLYILAYAQFSNVKLEVKSTNNPFRSSSLPVFHHYKHHITDLRKIVDYFKSKGHDADGSLSNKDQAEILAYENMLREKLYPAIQYTFWVDDTNRMEVVRPWYWKRIPFPFHFFYVGRYQSKAQDLISVIHPDVEDMKLKESYILAEAQACISHLATRLDRTAGPYFFGAAPSSLDALVFAYLGPLLKAPLKNSSFQAHARAQPNLARFVLSNCQNHFKTSYQEFEQKRRKEEKEKSDKGDLDFPHTLRNSILAAIFATCAMTGYAASIGLIHFSLRHK
uniref:Metaxin-1 n=2 Tax=Cacopsylla melanoneura TaxID=428564 RepID=A0A8D8ZRI0_9HEMI